MRDVFAKLLPGWGADAFRDLGRAGVLPVWGPEFGPPPPVPVAWHSSQPPDRPNDRWVLNDPTPTQARAAAGGAHQAWARCTTPESIQAAGGAGLGIWIAGQECGGPVGAYGALTLIRCLPKGARWVVEGLGLGGMAAACHVGASGAVVGPCTWLVQGSTLHDSWRPTLSRRLSARDTEVLGASVDWQARVLLRGKKAQHQALRGASLKGGEPLRRALSASLDQWWQRDGGACPAPESVPLAQRFAGEGSPLRAIQALRAAVSRHVAIAAAAPATSSRPVQGPMAHVAESVPFAKAVDHAGAIPFCALSALRPARADALLADFAAAGLSTWGAGLIGFDVMPHLEEHIELLIKHRPPVVLVAGGSPPLARRLAGEGLCVWLHTPSPGLVPMAFRAGAAAVVLEGRDAGGHVGRMSSPALWEEGLRRASELGGTVVLAGGIGDARSAAFARALAAPAMRAGVIVHLQAGTAFLLTDEAEALGAVAGPYRTLARRGGPTELVGASVGLPLRCIPNEFTLDARAQELAWVTEGVDLAQRRLALEANNLGRTRLSARGLQRGPTGGPRYVRAPDERQAHQGALTVGQGVAAPHAPKTLKGLVRALAAPLRVRSPWGRPTTVAGAPNPQRRAEAPSAPLRSAATPTGPEPIAIVGLGCIMPEAFDVAAFWSNLVRGVDAVAPVPPERWSIDRYYDPNAGTRGPALSYSKVAGAVRGFELDPSRYRIPPRTLRTIDPAQRMALAAADEALRGAGLRPGQGGRGAVILGNAMGGEYAKAMALRVRFHEVLSAALEEGLQLEPQAVAELARRIEPRLDQDIVPVEIDSMAGLLSNVIAGRVASWLDWMGGNLTVDAACASSLAAIGLAVDWLRSGRCDVALTGGVDADLSAETFVGFCRTRALSTAGSRPFSAHADGFVMGEGCGVFVLKRLGDAQRDGDPIWAVIRGVGQSSDGRGKGLTAPRPEGQALALKRAWAEAGADPKGLAFIEAHGTGTAVGDATEVSVLASWLGEQPRTEPVWLGSVKSNLGHLKGAAGAAGMLKAVLSLATGVLPPTLHAGPVNHRLPLRAGHLALPRSAVQLAADRPLAGVSAFGFGGTNFHIVIEAPPEGATVPAALAAYRRQAQALAQPAAQARWPTGPDEVHAAPLPSVPPPRVLTYAGQNPQALRDAVQRGELTPARSLGQHTHRAALVTDGGRQSEAHIALQRWLDGDAVSSGARQLGADTHVGSGDAPPIVLIAPGQGAQRPGALRSVAALPAASHALQTLDHSYRAARDALGLSELPERLLALDVDPLPTTTTWLHPFVYATSVAWVAVLREAGVPIAATLGHSLGEIAAVVAAGALSIGDGMALAMARGQLLHDAPRGAMLAISLSATEVQRLLVGTPLQIAAINGPRSTVIAGDTADVLRLQQALAAQRTPSVRLAVDHAFHTAAMASARDLFERTLATTPFATAAVPWLSAATAQLASPATALATALTRPVRFADAAQSARAHGAIFVELGPGGTLTSRLRRMGLDARCLALDPRPGRGLRAVHAAAGLLAAGHPELLLALPGVVLHEPALLTPAQARPPQAKRAPSGEPLRQRVLVILAEITGYAPDQLAQAGDLEADLGIDSIRKLEFMGRVQEALDVQLDPAASLDGLDIDGIVELVRTATPRAAAPEPTDRLHTYRSLPRPLPHAEATGPALPDPGSMCLIDGHLVLHAGPNAVSLLGITGVSPRPSRITVCGPVEHAAPAAAFARCVGQEWGVPVREVSWADGVSPDRRRSEVAAVDRPARVRLLAHGATAIESVAARVEPHTLEPQRWLATGGVSGIVLRCLEALPPGSSVMLLGRRHADEAVEALDRLAAAGLVARYQVCDVSDDLAVRAAVDLMGATMGLPTAILHGAGVLRDRTIERLTADDLHAVHRPKADGARALIRATAHLDLRLWVQFSSVVSSQGNATQAAYAHANASLEGIVHPRAARAMSLRWGPWAEVGMAANDLVRRALAIRGLRAIPSDAGARAFVSLLGASGTWTVSAHPLPTPPLPWPIVALSPTPEGMRAHLALTPEAPMLADHTVAGRPLVPAALWLHLFATTAARGLPHGCTVCITDFEVLRPTFVERPRDDLAIDLLPSAAGYSVRVTGPEGVLARAKLATVGPMPPQDLQPRPKPNGAPLYRRDLLFHGPALQGIQGLRLTDGAAQATVSSTSPVAAMDSAHQVLSLAAAQLTGRLALPLGASSWVMGPGGPVVQIRASVHADGTMVLGEATLLDAEGRVVAHAKGVRMQPAAPCPPRALEPYCE